MPYPGGPPGDVDLYIKPDLVPGCFATGLPASQAAVIAATQRPLAASAFTEPSGPPAWKTIPSWAVIGTGDQVIPPAELTFMAQRAGARITDVNAGHLSLISKPSVVTRVILKAVQGHRMTRGGRVSREPDPDSRDAGRLTRRRNAGTAAQCCRPAPTRASSAGQRRPALAGAVPQPPAPGGLSS